MKGNKMKNFAQGTSRENPIEISAEELSLIRARESTRRRRNNIEWFSL